MQQLGKKKFTSSQKKASHTIEPRSLSSFSLINRFGKVEIVNVLPEKVEKKEQYFKGEDFSGWCMPDQPAGYIKCRQYDFL